MQSILTASADNNGIKYCYVWSNEHAVPFADNRCWVRGRHSGTRWVGKTLSHNQEDNSATHIHVILFVMFN